jgi:hypothetical protein
VSRADRFVKEERYVVGLQDAYRATLVDQLQRLTRRGSWGLFGQQDLKLIAAGRADHIPSNGADLIEQGNAIAALRAKIGLGPFELHERFRAYRAMRGPDVPAEPKLAALLLDEIAAMDAAALESSNATRSG